MLDYDLEADRYDETRGGRPRALAAAEALDRLLPADAGPILDIAAGTGIVGRALHERGRHVLGLDLSSRSRPRRRRVSRPPACSGSHGRDCL